MVVPSEPAFSHPVSEQRLGQEGQAGMRGVEGTGLGMGWDLSHGSGGCMRSVSGEDWRAKRCL